MQTLPCSADDTHARWCRWCVFPSIPWPLFVASQRVHRVGQGLPVLLETLLSAFNVRTLSSTGGLLRSTCWLTGQARSVRVCIPEGFRTSFGLTMPSFRQARPLGRLLRPHRAFQEHATHHAEWSAPLSSKGSSDTLYIRGWYQHCRLPLSRRTRDIQ